jgi:Kef-type K+ transport system membrane component KefB/nucleotide-binding universal stress UspA family protein
MFEIPFKDPVVIFTIVVFIMLVVPLVLKRFRIPGIVGLILSGVIIGPHGLGLLEKNIAINLFATIGLLYIMFLAGLELDLNKFQKTKNRSIVFGMLTFIIPISIGLPICYYVLEFDFTASFLTSIMFATHTLIAYPIVSKKRLATNEAVGVAVGGTIFTDTAVLVIFTFIAGSQINTIDFMFFVRTLGGILLFLIVAFFIIPRLTRWFFKFYIGEQSAHYLFVLFVVFLLAVLSVIAGVEPIIGAFAAGLALNRFIPHTSALFNRVSFIGNTLFIPFFLISVGMIVDLSILFNGTWAIQVALILTAMAITGKWLAALVTQKIFHYSPDQRRLIFGLSSSHAAATLAIIIVGFQLKMIDEQILNGTIVLILITCLVATIVTERATQRIIISKGTGEALHGHHVERILVPVVNPLNIEKLIDLAVLIKQKNSELPINVVTVVKDTAESIKKISENRKKLQPIVHYAETLDTKIDIRTTIDLNATSGILRSAMEITADKLILGWKGKTRFAHNIFGDMYEGIIERFNGTIMIARFLNPLKDNNELKVIIPPGFHEEPGFIDCLQIVCNLTNGLKLKTTFIGKSNELNLTEELIVAKNIDLTFFKNPYEKQELLSLQELDVKPTDLFMFLSSRNSSSIYHSYMAHLPARFDKVTNEWSFIIIYPPQKEFLQQDSSLQKKVNQSASLG